MKTYSIRSQTRSTNRWLYIIST